MNLTSFEISDFRKFDRPVRLEGLGPGINVLAEPNEFGKSTLLAALKAVLFEQHRAKGKASESMRHFQNATSPVLKLGFEVGGGLHRIEKRFMHREPYARLTLPDGTRIEGDAAEEQLQSILGFGAPSRGGATADSVGLWGALWVAQQQALQQPDLQPMARATLHACLEAELGTLAGGDRSGALSGQVKAELSVLLDGNGRPKGRLKDIGEQIVSADATLVQLRAKRVSLEEAISELARKRQDLAHASDSDAESLLANDIVDARRRRDDVLQYQLVLQGAVTAMTLAARHHGEAAGETGSRASRRQKIAAAKAVLGTARDEEVRLLEDQVAAEALLTSRREAVSFSEGAATVAAQNLKVANAVSALVMRSGQIVRLDGHLGRAMTAQAEVNRLTGELSANPADAARLQAVTTASGALDRARSVLDAQATEIVFDLERGAVVQVSGATLPAGSTLRRVVEDTAIDIAGIGRVRVRPAIRDRATLQAAVTSAEAAMTIALRAIGAADPAEAACMATARASLAERLKAAEAALTSETPGEATIGLGPGLEALRNHVDAGRSRLTVELKALDLAALPTLVEADAALELVKKDEAAAVSALADARTALVGPMAEHDRAATAQRQAVLAASQARSALATLEQEETAALATEPDADLATRLQVAQAELAGQRELVAQTQRAKPADTVEDMDARIKRLEGAGTSRLDIIRQLREEIAALTARIVHEEGEGLDEKVADLERLRENLASEQATLSREVAVLTLLRDTLAEAEREARERYVAPVMRRMTPYLQSLFPGVEVAFGDNLQITSLTRQAGAEDLDRLSDGTVEQIAVLLRLAYADLLVERGKPAMLVLDDALAYSDRHRLELIFDTLTRAAERMQILVLTCRVDAFSRLGGNRLRLVST